MAQYIDKDIIIEKIDNLISNLRYTKEDEALQIDILSEVESIINTLETKEINQDAVQLCPYSEMMQCVCSKEAKK